MIQLTYQPSLDPFHTTFRLLRLRSSIIRNPMPLDEARILDFFIIFPFLLDKIRLPIDENRHKILAKQYSSKRPYSQFSDNRILFERMRPIQAAAIQTLVKNGFFDADGLQGGLLSPTAKKIPEEIMSRIAEENTNDHSLLDFLRFFISEYKFLGEDGIKHRTKLMEHAYDAL